MIKLALFDVGETLIHDNQPLPHVHAALATISEFETATGDALVLGVVSDFDMPAPPPTEAKIIALELEFLRILKSAGLDALFDPLESRITLSSRAGVFKPDRRIFELAIQRSGVSATLKECLFVTENQDHLDKCREFGMTVLKFGLGANEGSSFTDWSEAPLLVARLVAPGRHANLKKALRIWLAATHDLELTHSETGVADQPLRCRGKTWIRLDDPSLGELRDVHVQLPVNAEVQLDPRGRVASVAIDAPEAEDRAEAVAHVQSLISSGQVERGSGRPPQVATHRIEVDKHGRRLLKRQRFTLC